MLSFYLPAEPVLLFVLVVSAHSVWLSFLQTTPAFQFPPSFSQPQPESRVFAQFLCGVFARNGKNREKNLSHSHQTMIRKFIIQTSATEGKVALEYSPLQEK